MTFRNWIMLFGLLGVLAPVLIHLFSRRRAKRIDWGATLFLIGSLRHRSRAILIEEVLALILRCLLVALLALAMARPFLPAGGSLLGGLLLPGLLLAAVLLGAGTAMRRRRAWRWALYGMGAALAAVALLASAGEHNAQVRRWTGTGGGQDVAIVIDASNSMAVTADGKTNFQRALEEARRVIAARKPGDNILLVAAGPSPRAVPDTPTGREEELQAALAAMTPGPGVMDPAAALRRAAEVLAHSPNALKTFVVLTDAQASGWRGDDDAYWQPVIDALKAYPQPPRLICRTLPLPEDVKNLAVSSLQVRRAVVGTDRPVAMTVRVDNTGGDLSVPFELTLEVGDGEILRGPVGALEPGGSETVRFLHRFTRTGPRPVRAFAPYADDIPADNTDALVVSVATRLPVLIVDGSPSRRALDSASGFLRVALSPPAGETPSEQKTLVDAKVLAATALGDEFDFSPYRAVVLADVPRLPGRAAAALADFVNDGGGLWIAAGERVEADFYNAWVLPDGLTVTGARFVERRVCGSDDPAGVDPATVELAALESLADPEQSDIGRALFTAYWVLRPAGGPARAAAARFTTGDPFVLERTVGKGRVLTTAVGLDARAGNFPTLSSFVAFAHEMVCHAAGTGMGAVRLAPDDRQTFWLDPATARKPAVKGQPPKPGGPLLKKPVDVEVEGPEGARLAGRIEATDTGALAFHVPNATAPGLYRIRPPVGLVDALAPALDRDGMLPFAVAGSAAESRLTPMSDAERNRIDGRLAFVRLDTAEQLVAAVSGGIPGQEIWRLVALAAFALVLAETALARWIARQRRGQGTGPVRFSANTGDVTSHQAAMRAMLKKQ